MTQNSEGGAGVKMLGREPTEEMITAAHDHDLRWAKGLRPMQPLNKREWRDAAIDRWRAMFDAAPAAPAAPSAGVVDVVLAFDSWWREQTRKAGMPIGHAIAYLRKVVDFGGHDGFGADPYHEKIADLMEGLDVALKSQIEITNNERAAKEAAERRLQSALREREADRVDAERYRWLRDENKHMHYGQNHIGGTTPGERLLMAVHGDPRLFECITLEVPLAHVPKDGEPIWCREPGDAPDAEAGHFDFAANLDAAIDSARGENGKG